MKTDAEIQKDVIEELGWEPSLSVSEIGVTVKEGIVTLSGTFDSYTKKAIAEKAAARVSGVKAVAEDIVVQISQGDKKNDTEIAKAVADALKWHSAVQENKIKVFVEDAWVTLEGEVSWDYQRTAAKLMLENISGIQGIKNNIIIVPQPTVSNIKSKISAALQRSAVVDAENINIQIDGNKVILTGKVKSQAEKSEAETVAWFSPGVTTVENKLEIDTQVVAY